MLGRMEKVTLEVRVRFSLARSIPIMRPAWYARHMNTTHTAATNAMIAPQIRYMDVLFSCEIMFVFPLVLSRNDYRTDTVSII